MVVNTSVTPSVAIAAVPSGSVCPGTSITFTATPTNGGTTPGYQWTVDGVNAGSGSTLTGVYNDGQIIGCTLTSTATCASPTTATASPITVSVYTVIPVSVIDNAGTLTSSVASGNQWYEQTSGIIIGATSQYYTPTANGNYYTIVTDSHGCIATSNIVSITNVGIEVNTINSGISIYPNPTNGLVNITFGKAIKDGTISIENALGQKVYENSLTQTEHSVKVIDFRAYAVGVYFINIKDKSTNFRQQVVFDNK
jgi:hypothetical protein